MLSPKNKSKGCGGLEIVHNSQITITASPFFTKRRFYWAPAGSRFVLVNWLHIATLMHVFLGCQFTIRYLHVVACHYFSVAICFHLLYTLHLFFCLVWSLCSLVKESCALLFHDKNYKNMRRCVPSVGTNCPDSTQCWGLMLAHVGYFF